MISDLSTWGALALGLPVSVAAVLLVIWWRQQSYRWVIVLLVCLLLAPLFSWWSGLAFDVPDYRAGCDGLCPGYRGAPIHFVLGAAAGNQLLFPLFLLNTLVYLALLLGWGAVMRAVIYRGETEGRGDIGRQIVLTALLSIAPLALASLYLPPPEAHVRGDPLRLAINAEREVYLYNQLARLPVVRVGLEDVRPRPDDQIGMRVCFRMYTYFYLPTGYMYMDMTAEGVHSNAGGVLPLAASCWD